MRGAGARGGPPGPPPPDRGVRRGPGEPPHDLAFPKEARLLRRSDFREVYDKGFRVSGAAFAGVCLAVEGQARARVGFAMPKALGGSVIRHRIKRRLSEAARVNLGRLGPQWKVVLQGRKTALTASFADLVAEVERLFSRCGP